MLQFWDWLKVSCCNWPRDGVERGKVDLSLVICRLSLVIERRQGADSSLMTNGIAWIASCGVLRCTFALLIARRPKVLLALIRPETGEPMDVSPWSVSRWGDFRRATMPIIAPKFQFFCTRAKRRPTIAGELRLAELPLEKQHQLTAN